MDIPRERKTRRRWLRLLPALALAAIGASGYYGLSRLDGGAIDVDRAAVWIGDVERGPLRIEVRAAGRLVPQGARRVAAPIDGVIEEVLARPGDSVVAGELLLRLSNREVQRAYLEARLETRTERAAAQAEETRLHNQLLDMHSALGALELQIRETELTLEADLQLQQAGLVAPLDIDVARLRLDELRKRFEVEQQRMARRESTLPVELDALKVRVERAEALERFRRREVDALDVRAAGAGVVSEIETESGRRIARGDSLGRLIEPSRLKAELDVPQVRAQEVQPGQTCRIDTRNGTFEGRIDRIDPAVQAGIVRVEVLPSSPLPEGARAELRVDGRIEIDRLDDTVFVQRPANARAGATLAMFRVEPDGQAHRVEVSLGKASVNRIEIRRGLQPGQRVILSDTSEWSQAKRLRLR